MDFFCFVDLFFLLFFVDLFFFVVFCCFVVWDIAPCVYVHSTYAYNAAKLTQNHAQPGDMGLHMPPLSWHQHDHHTSDLEP